MNKVRTIFLLRRLVAPFAFLAVATIVVVSTVSVSHVLANMPTVIDIPAVMRFFATAFAHTDVVVKSALVAGALFLILVLKGVVDSLKFSNFIQRI